jgi:hypothetical protein
MTTVSVNYKGILLYVEGDYEPGSPGSLYDRYGDPGSPPEASGFEISKIRYDPDNEEDLDIFDLIADSNALKEIATLAAEGAYAASE